MDDAERFCADAAEWLRRWDAGEPVWTLEVFGADPAIEHQTQAATAEIVRLLLDKKYDLKAWADDEERYRRERQEIEMESRKNAILSCLPLDGLEWATALNLACNIVREGPVKLMNDKRITNRRIKVKKA